jgi:hypothetical protein
MESVFHLSEVTSDDVFNAEESEAILTRYSLYKHGDFYQIEKFSSELQGLAEQQGVTLSSSDTAVLSSPSGLVQSSSYALAQHFARSAGLPHIALKTERRINPKRYTSLSDLDTRLHERQQ